MKYALMAVALLGLAACEDLPRDEPLRFQPGGTFYDPLCMPDGSVVLWEWRRANGTFDETTAKRENCVWYRPPAKS